MFSGAMCFMLEAEWFTKLSPGTKVPVYTMLGMSVCFALMFSFIDLLNVAVGQCQSSRSKPLVDTPAQV